MRTIVTPDEVVRPVSETRRNFDRRILREGVARRRYVWVSGELKTRRTGDGRRPMSCTSVTSCSAAK